MSIWPILLRLCLCFALVFNGATTAMASVQVTHMHAQGALPNSAANEPAPLVSNADGAMPCHEQGAQSGTGAAQSSISPDKGSPASSHAGPDCCNSDTCRCACMHHGLAAIPTMPFNTDTLEHVDRVRPMAIGHATPALPQLIRPPIG